MKNNETSLNIWGIILFGGLAKGFAFHPFSFSFLLGWICLIPLIYSISQNQRKYPFIEGYFFGIIFNFFGFYWIGLNSGTSSIIAYSSLIMAVLYLSIFWGFLTLFLSYFERFEFKLIIFPFSLVILEWLRSLGPLGFSWSNLALTQINFLQLMQISEFLGSFGISFFVAVINVVFYLILFQKKYKLIFFFTFFILMIFEWGEKKINYFNEYDNKIDVAIIQPNIDPNLKWISQNKRNVVNHLDSLFEVSLNMNVDLVLFPEAAYPTYLRIDSNLRNKIQQKVDSSGVPILVGTIDKVKINSEVKYFNSSIFFSPKKESKLYNKIFLVPFAEYVPLSEKLSILKKINFGQANFTKGQNIALFKIDSLNIGNVICYESSNPNLVSKFIRKGANILAIQTNDGYLGESSGPYQHFNIAKMRAIENRVPIIRSGNTGISGLILPSGVSNKKIKLGRSSIIKVGTPIMKAGSFYTKYGDIFVLFCLLSIIIFYICFKKDIYSC